MKQMHGSFQKWREKRCFIEWIKHDPLELKKIEGSIQLTKYPKKDNCEQGERER